MGIHAVNRRLAALGHARQLRASARADASAYAADRAAGAVWQDVLRLLRERPGWAEAQVRAQAIFARLVPTITGRIAAVLRPLALASYRGAAIDLRRAVPAKLLAKSLVRRVKNGSVVLAPGGHAARLALGEGLETPLREDEAGQPAWKLAITDLFKLFGLTPPAAADTGPAAAPGAIDYGRLSAFLKHLGSRDNLPAFGLAQLLFAAPTETEIARVVYASGWQDRLAAASRLAPPAQMASILASGLAAGKSQQQIARDLLPAVEGVRASARRVARTEALRVAGAMQMQAHEALGDLVIGYRAHAVIDEHSRPWHAARSGTVYYKEPGPGQKGLDQMPRPPDEPADPNERPPGTPATAFNCRCTLFPVLKDPAS